MKAKTPADRCQYCNHSRAQHDRPEPGNPPPALRCSRGCVCPAFIEADGRPDWQHERDARRTIGRRLMNAFTEPID